MGTPVSSTHHRAQSGPRRHAHQVRIGQRILEQPLVRRPRHSQRRAHHCGLRHPGSRNCHRMVSHAAGMSADSSMPGSRAVMISTTEPKGT